MNALEFAPAYNSGQGVPGAKMEKLNKGPSIPKKLRRKKTRKILSPKRQPYVAAPHPPIRTDEGAR